MDFNETFNHVEIEIAKACGLPIQESSLERIRPYLELLVQAARGVELPADTMLTKDQVDLTIALAGQTGEWYIYHSGIESNVDGREIEYDSYAVSQERGRERDGYRALGELLAVAKVLANA